MKRTKNKNMKCRKKTRSTSCCNSNEHETNCHNTKEN